MKENGEKIIKWCKENKYKAYYLKEGLEFNDSDMIATRGKCHLLLIPINDFYPEYLKSVKQKDELPNTLN